VVEYIHDKLFEYGKEVAVVAGSGLLAGFWKIFKKKSDIEVEVNLRCRNCGLCKHKTLQVMKSFIINVDNPSWKCINSYKTEVSKDAIRDKFTVGHLRIKEWVCANKDVANSADLVDSFNDMIVSMIQEYENKWNARGINKIIIDRLSLYHTHNAKIAIRVGSLELKREYNNTVDSIHHMLDALLIPYAMFITDIRAVMDSVNGSLKGDVYKGIVNNGEHIDMEISRLQFSFEKDE